jgi:hypothetical protein
VQRLKRAKMAWPMTRLTVHSPTKAPARNRVEVEEKKMGAAKSQSAAGVGELGFTL